MGEEPLTFDVTAADGAARVGRVRTGHGDFDTPAFMPVGTQGTVKGMLPDQLAACGTQIVLANTYHLMLRPGERVVAELGGLHGLMAWPGPILTDSGGYQVFSLSDINWVGEEGVKFKSHIDGSEVELTPRRSMEVQNALGADIIMALDHCLGAGASAEAQAGAVQRTLRWARQCLQSHGRAGEQALFGIVQGGTDLDLRRRCADELVGMDFPGYALGGLAVGEGFAAMAKVLLATVPLLPAQKPRYLMGVGYPRDIVEAVASGVDMFDCVLPTRNGRNAYAFTAGGALRLRNSTFARDQRPTEEGCGCYACRHFSRGAIRHYFFAGEMLGPVLVSVHNVWFFQRFLADVRRAVARGELERFRKTDARCALGPGKNAKPASAAAKRAKE